MKEKIIEILRNHSLIGGIVDLYGVGDVVAEEIDNLYKEQAKEQWISVNDKLPKDLETVICYSPKSEISVFPGYYAQLNEVWTNIEFERRTDGITHWTPLQKPPLSSGYKKKE
jgi:hypothetical protein